MGAADALLGTVSPKALLAEKDLSGGYTPIEVTDVRSWMAKKASNLGGRLVAIDSVQKAADAIRSYVSLDQFAAEFLAKCGQEAEAAREHIRRAAVLETVVCTIRPEAFGEVESWLGDLSSYWNSTVDRLEELLRGDDDGH